MLIKMVEIQPLMVVTTLSFGQVIDGMDVVDKIASAETDNKDKPKQTSRLKNRDLKRLQFKNNEKRTKQFSFLSNVNFS